MENVLEISSKENSKSHQIKAILFLLQSNLENFSNEVDRSYALLNIGEKTTLSKKIKDTLENPFRGIFDLSSDIDSTIKELIDKLVVKFLKKNKEIIKAVLRNKTTLNDLHYSVILIKDSIEYREQIFNFYDFYDLLEVSSRYPVYFQFVPIELIDKIRTKETVVLD